MYAVQASVLRTWPDGSSGHIQIPTFYLDENVQGIVGEEHAKNIAREIIDPCNCINVISIHVEKVP